MNFRLGAFASVLLLSSSVWAGQILSPQQRIEAERLSIIRADRQRFARERSVAHIPNHGLYQDFRAILNVRASQADRAAVLQAAKDAGVQVLLFNDETLAATVTKDGVLCLSATEDDQGVLKLASADRGPDLRFYPPFEAPEKMDSAKHAGAFVIDGLREAVDLGDFLKKSSIDPQKWPDIAARFKEFPDEVFAASSNYRGDVFEFYDSQSAQRAVPAIASTGARQSIKIAGDTFDPWPVVFRHLSTHILARDLSESDVRTALRDGHAYLSHDWLCDPTGFAFAAFNNLGLHTMGDRIPHYSGNTRILAFTPVKARLKLFHNGVLIQETVDSALTYHTQKEGAYRVEAWLTVGGEERPWIYSNPIYVQAPTVDSVTSLLYPAPDSTKVEIQKDIPYVDLPTDEAKQKLDLYIPKGVAKPPVLLFMHGGAWRFGDRNLYFGFGTRFASQGILVIVPSYRLAPKFPHPAQIEDTAAAFAWVVKNIEKYGGDSSRIFVAGHSAGGHLVALLTLDESHLKPHGLSPKLIRGTIAHSGVYDLVVIGDSQASVFGNNAGVRRKGSPLFHIKEATAPFLVGYCQWDYPTLPAQAREFCATLQAAGTKAELIYVPNENHISEMLSILNDQDPLFKSALPFILKR